MECAGVPAARGFVYAITPFNFTSIGGNLPSAPAIMGCTVVWKPAGTAAYSNYFLLKVLEEAGLPPAVINFIPGPAAQVVGHRVETPRTSAASTYGPHRGLPGAVAEGRDQPPQVYADYPRLVGETGGKDFILAHPTPTSAALATAIGPWRLRVPRSEVQRPRPRYVPANLLAQVKERVSTCSAR